MCLPMLWQMHLKFLGVSGELADRTDCSVSSPRALCGSMLVPLAVVTYPVSALKTSTLSLLVRLYSWPLLGRKGELLHSIMAVLIVSVEIS